MDHLSRHTIPITKTNKKDSKARRNIVQRIVNDTLPKSILLTEIQEATRDDPQMTKLVSYIQQEKLRECQKGPLTSSFAKIFSELSYVEGIIMRGNWIVIPENLRKRVIEICHESHMGIVKTKQLLISKVWFPGIDQRVENLIADCLPCQVGTNRTARDPLDMSPLLKGLWVQVSADVCGLFPTGELALVAPDAYLWYPEIEIVKSTSAESIILAFERIFSIHGIPEEVKTDNGTLFQSQAFEKFLKEKGFSH